MLDTRTIHTSGASDSSSLPGLQPTSPGAPSPSDDGATLDQCMAEFNAANSGCAGASVAPGTPCCDGVLALGSNCLSMLARAASQPGAEPTIVSAV